MFMSLITEIIIWCSPVLFGAFLWMAHEVYTSFKGDIGDLKKSNANLRTDVAKQGVMITSLDTKVSTVCRSVESIQKSTHEIDKRTANVTELNGAVKSLSERIDKSDKKYGQVLMILDGIAVKLGLKVKRSGS